MTHVFNYNIGQTVFGCQNKRNYIKKTCTFCDGTGVVSGADGTHNTCPAHHCRSGLVDDGFIDLWTPTCSMEILRASVQITKLNDYGGQEVVERYMTDVTGCPSGRLWDHIDLASTLEEAEKMCNERNESEGEDE